MTYKKIQAFRNQIRSSKAKKKHEEALQGMVDLGDYFNGYRMFAEALTEYRIAKEYSSKLKDGNPKKAQLLYEADYGYLQALAEFEKSRIAEALNEFIAKYPVMSEDLDMIKRQDAAQLIAYCYFKMKDYDTARQYSVLSFELLEILIQQLQPASKDFKKKEEDYEIRKAQLYYLHTDIALAEKKYKEAKENCDKALACRGIEKDSEVYYHLLNVKRKYLFANDRLEVSLLMHSLWTKNKKHKLKDDGLNTFWCLFQDYAFIEDYETAEHQLWLAYKEKESIKKVGEENCVIKNLNEWYKLSERLTDFNNIKHEDVVDIRREYEKIARGFFNMKAYELAYKYYEKMLQLIPKDDFLNRKAILEPLIKCLDKFVKTQEDFVNTFTYCDELYGISKNLNIPDLAERKLDRAISYTKLDIHLFDGKKKALMEVKEELKDDKEFVKFFTASTSLLKDNQTDESEQKDVAEKLKLYQERIKDANKSDDVKITPSSTDKYDEMSPGEIFNIMVEKWTKYEKVESLKKKINETDRYGYTGLHKAVEKKDFDELMLDEAGYKAIINEQDAGGKTALFQAVMNEEHAIAGLLIENGASSDISTTDKGSKYPAGRTALMEAASLRNTVLIRLLLVNNANPLLKDQNGKMASDYLKEKLKICHAILNNLGCPKVDIKEKEELATTLTKSEYKELKDTLKLLKNVEEEREKKNKEHDGDKLKVETNVEEENTGTSSSRKRSSSEILTVSKRSKSN